MAIDLSEILTRGRLAGGAAGTLAGAAIGLALSKKGKRLKYTGIGAGLGGLTGTVAGGLAENYLVNSISKDPFEYDVKKQVKNLKPTSLSDFLDRLGNPNTERTNRLFKSVTDHGPYRSEADAPVAEARGELLNYWMTGRKPKVHYKITPVSDLSAEGKTWVNAVKPGAITILTPNSEISTPPDIDRIEDESMGFTADDWRIKNQPTKFLLNDIKGIYGKFTAESKDGKKLDRALDLWDFALNKAEKADVAKGAEESIKKQWNNHQLTLRARQLFTTLFPDAPVMYYERKT